MRGETGGEVNRHCLAAVRTIFPAFGTRPRSLRKRGGVKAVPHAICPALAGEGREPSQTNQNRGFAPSPTLPRKRGKV
jgi:hypothetical protein